MTTQEKEMLRITARNEKSVIDELKTAYEQARDGVEQKIIDLQNRPDLQDISVVRQLRYQQALKEELDGILDNLHNGEYATIDQYLHECYETGYLGSMYQLQGYGLNYTFPIDQREMVAAITTDSKLSVPMYDRLGEDVEKLKTDIRFELTRGLSSGESFQTMAGVLARGMNSPFNTAWNNSIRIARTEGGRIQSEAQYNSQKHASERGADIVKIWDATLDGKTRDAHRRLDGQIRNINESFEIDGLEARYPHDFGVASMDINCRCASISKPRWLLDAGFTKMDNFTGELQEFDSPKSYEEFKKQFWSDENIKRMNYTEALEKKYGTKNWNEIVKQMTPSEVEKLNTLETAVHSVDVVDLPTLKTDIVSLGKQIYQLERDVRYNGYNTDKVNKLTELRKKQISESKTYLQNLNTTFKVDKPSEDFCNFFANNVLPNDVDYKEVFSMESKLSFDEIVSRLGGGDRTSGSCASVGLGYIGNKFGWNVLDFRDGESRYMFGGKSFKTDMWNALGVPYHIENSAKSSVTNGVRALNQLVPGHEYYLSVGRHASIVRAVEKDVIDQTTGEWLKTEKVFQYLELQSGRVTGYTNGWHNFDGNPRYTLTNRFGCSSSSALYPTAFLTDLDDIKDTPELRTMLGFINTVADAQKKGLNGTIK